MRLWRVELIDSDGDRRTASVLAPDAEKARDAAVADPGGHFGPLRASAVHELDPVLEILDLHMPDLDVERLSSPAAEGLTLWQVNWNDGLFHRSAGASLVAAADAIAALRMVIDADPFEGRPPYGVPAAYGPVVRFVPAEPILLWIALD